MAEEFQGGVCGGTWWNPNLFSGVDASFTSPCSVAQLGGGYDMASFGWPHQVIKTMPNNDNNNNNQVYDNNSLVSSTNNFDSTLDILGFAPSPTLDWNQQNQFGKIGINEENIDSILLQDNPSTRLNNELGQSTSTMMNNSSNFLSQDESPPTTMTTTSSNNSGDSSEVGSLCTGFPMSSTTSYLIQTLFEDFDDQSKLTTNTTNDYGRELMSPPCLWPKSTSPLTPPSPLELVQTDQLFNGGMNMVVNNDEILLNNIRASLLNSLQSRSRAPSLNQKSHKFPTSQATKLNHEEVGQESKKKMKNNNEQPAAKRPRIETPSSLPTFKVRKEKLGDRITALQQLVSPFGKTDTASVLHEAIEYIKFLHDQVHVLTTPYLKDGAGVQHQQQVSAKIGNNDETKKDLRSRGLCVVPISSTYPVTQETPVDFWTPTFGGATFR